MARRKKKGYDSGLRTRGGASLRKRWTRIMKNMRDHHKCPNCTTKSVKRQGVGIWSCKKCGYRFAGGAYLPATKLGQAATRIRQLPARAQD